MLNRVFSLTPEKMRSPMRAGLWPLVRRDMIGVGAEIEGEKGASETN
jgi:hypothetical protein